MNWTKGLFRAWVVVSVIWVALVGVISVATWPAPWELDPIVKDLIPELEEAREELQTENRYKILWHLGSTASAGVVPPILLLLFGWGLLWTARGFAAKHDGSS